MKSRVRKSAGVAEAVAVTANKLVDLEAMEVSLVDNPAIAKEFAIRKRSQETTETDVQKKDQVVIDEYALMDAIAGALGEDDCYCFQILEGNAALCNCWSEDSWDPVTMYVRYTLDGTTVTITEKHTATAGWIVGPVVKSIAVRPIEKGGILGKIMKRFFPGVKEPGMLGVALVSEDTDMQKEDVQKIVESVVSEALAPIQAQIGKMSGEQPPETVETTTTTETVTETEMSADDFSALVADTVQKQLAPMQAAITKMQSVVGVTTQPAEEIHKSQEAEPVSFKGVF